MYGNLMVLYIIEHKFTKYLTECTCSMRIKSELFLNIQEISDERLKHANEMFSGIKLLKMYAWDMIFCRNVEKIRKNELKLKFTIAMLTVATRMFIILLLSCPIRLYSILMIRQILEYFDNKAIYNI